MYTTNSTENLGIQLNAWYYATYDSRLSRTYTLGTFLRLLAPFAPALYRQYSLVASLARASNCIQLRKSY
ncbi:MAG: hypothetical protein Greene041614_517 [Parcubacteria group bacterium Greene0416_14]|nr:MAG: hypothetical protein Greene041614_517 [Parcubacteria group bacterium Greene0416_14]TSD01662.1 MAG: hypothetical protein Greene101415_60 [Parcubacteria group bacterium Greene1014_15]